MTKSSIVILFLILFMHIVLFQNRHEIKHNILFAISSTFYIFVIMLRSPSLLSMHRIWAESATLYFSYGYKYGPFWALLNPASNYLDLSANLASFVAVLAGLRWWPIVDTGLGYAAALSVPLAVFGAIKDPKIRLAVLTAIGMSVCCVSAAETFGTVLHNKGWGAVYAAFALLALATGSRPGKTVKFLLFITPFTGTPALFLILIWASGLIALRRKYLLPPLLYSIPGVMTQIIFFLLPSQSSGLAARSLNLNALSFVPDLVLQRLIGSIVWPSIFFSNLNPGYSEIVFSTIVFLAIIIGTFALSIRNNLWLVIVTAIGLFVASSILALGGASTLLQSTYGLRYYFPSVAIILSCSISMLATAPRRLQAAATLLSLAVVYINLNHDSSFFGFWTPESPSWAQQVEAQATKKNQEFSIYPNGWKLTLPQCGAYHC
jgi:hypothetical protein